MSAPLVAVDGLTVRRQGCPVVDGAAFAAVAGERLAVVGPNGAGKSTLLKALAGVLPHAGELTLAPAVARLPRGLRFAYLPQETAFHWPMPVRDVVALGRLPHGWRGGRLSGADHAAVARAIAEAGLAGYEARAVDRLSGGEKARVALARALAVEAPALLADEPVAALDARHQQAVMMALAGRAAAGALVVAVLHDLTLAARWANRVLLVDRGRLVADGAPAEILTPQRLEPVYGVAFDVAKLPGGPTVLPRA